MKQYYIYLTTNLINNKKYIGQHFGELEDSYFGSGILIMKAINKYGKENFKKEILSICKNRQEADQQEKDYILKFNAIEDENFYNLQEGGTGGDGWRACKRWFEKHPEKAQEVYKKNGEYLQKWRKEHPEEFQEKAVKPLIESSKKYWENHPEERKKLMIKVNQAKKEWQKAHPEEHQKQVDEWRKAGSKANSQKILCITTNQIFESQCAAARYFKIQQCNISKCLKGERKSAGKDPKTGKKLYWKLV